MIRSLRIQLLATALLAQPGAGPAGAALLLVPEEQPTIAAALGSASFRDTVSLAPGTYYEHDLVWPPGVSILGRSGDPGWVVIDAQLQDRVLGGDNLVPANELASVTLRNGSDLNSGYGSGLMVRGDPILRDLIIEDCTSNHGIYGIGLYVQGGATITDCVLRNNRSTDQDTEGGGAWLLPMGIAHPITVRNLEVYGNQAHHSSGVHVNDRQAYFEGLHCHDNLGSGLVAYNGSTSGIGPTIENSLFVNNIGSGIAFDAGVVIRNCTFVGNGAPGYWTGAIHSGSTWDHPMDATITECIIANNLGSGISWWDATPYTIECNDVHGNAYANYVNLPDLTGNHGNISVDPQFCGAGGGNFALQADSPCAPAGNDCGLLMGAYPVACGNTGTKEASWGAIKALY